MNDELEVNALKTLGISCLKQEVSALMTKSVDIKTSIEEGYEIEINQELKRERDLLDQRMKTLKFQLDQVNSFEESKTDFTAKIKELEA